MKILINSNNKLEIIMKDKDILDISTKKIGIKSQIKCMKGTLHFDNISYKELNNLKNEKQSMMNMDKYLKNKE